MNHLRIKQVFFLVIFLLSFMKYNFCSAQQKTITSYQEKDHAYLNITLNGKVRVMKQISYLPNNSCDTIPYIIDTSRFRVFNLGEVIPILCTSDTLIYFFDSNSLIERINDIHYSISTFNKRYYKKILYKFVNGNLISETTNKDGELILDTKATYKYDSKNKLIVKKENYYNGVFIIDSLEYNNNNNLTKKTTYRYDFWEKGKPDLYAFEAYEYDSLGNMITKVASNWKRIYKYDRNGNMIEEDYCTNNADIFNSNKKCKYKPLHGYVYDEQNRKVKSFQFGGQPPCTNIETHYEYDEKGNNIEVKGFCITKDTILDYHCVYEYNENGQQTREEKKVGSYGYIGFERYKTLITTYSDYQNITQQGYYLNGNQVVKIIQYVFEYDSLGNWIKREKYEGISEQDLHKKTIEERVIEYY